MSSTVRTRILQVIAAVALAVTCIAIGFAICAGFPMITRALSLSHSQFDASPYSASLLTDLAEQTRDFTIEGASSEGEVEMAAETLASEVLAAAQTSMVDPEKQSRWTEAARSIVGAWEAGSVSAETAMEQLYELDPSYALDRDALSHLEDVNEVVSSVRMPLLGCTLIAAFCLMCLVMMFGPVAAARALIAGGCLALGLFLVFGLWALVGFDGFFAWLHGLFFADNSWTFPSNSLLIHTYPEGFWMGMGLWWLGSSSIVAVASIVIGGVIVHRSSRARKATPPEPAGLQA